MEGAVAGMGIRQGKEVRMKDRLFIAVVLLAVAVFVVFQVTKRENPPIRPQDAAAEQREAPRLRVFQDAQGRKAQFSMPLLDTFPYPGDAELCTRMKALAPQGTVDGFSALAECGDLSALPPLDKSARLIKLAEQVGNFRFFTEDMQDPDPDSGVVLALSALSGALDVLPPQAFEQAFEVFDASWVASLATEKFTHYSPPFLLRDALAIEAGEAKLALCPLFEKMDCKSYLPGGIIASLTSVGRWKSDEHLLLRAADLLEARHKSRENPDRNTERVFAEDYSAALGYAGEIAASREDGTAYFRRGAKPLERWLEENERGTDDDTLSGVIVTLGAQYGRIADRTGDKADAEKAVQYDMRAYQLKLKLGDRIGRWRPLANLGDSTLLLAEIEQNEAGFREALRHHRDALDITREAKEREGVKYMEMKLARTLLHYAKAAGLKLPKEDRVAMLEESIATARGVMPFLSETGTETYLRIVRQVLSEAEKYLGELQREAAKTEP